jgi:hypothetical protein
MNRTQLPAPPNPMQFSPTAWQTAVYQWMQQVKGRIEADSTVNIQPVAPFQVGTYTPVMTLIGTDTVSNFLATLVTALTAKGLVAPTSQRTSE